jgi:type IV secretory pathway TrbD component
MHGPRETVFHSSINRPNLLMGGDRELVLGAAMISAMFIFQYKAYYPAKSRLSSRSTGQRRAWK